MVVLRPGVAMVRTVVHGCVRVLRKVKGIREIRRWCCNNEWVAGEDGLGKEETSENSVVHGGTPIGNTLGNGYHRVAGEDGLGKEETGENYVEEMEVAAPDTVATETASVTGFMSTSHHGIEVAVEFKPDGRIWKERVSAGVQRRADLPVMQEETGGPPEPETPRTKSRPRTNRMILPSISAPEHNILKLLEECHASGM
ncbi:hypothetical protein Ccrd_006314 [Cynara cardunculus var. scolymus]|uniref:Uncharacterized protein n=1 Tax=Cynara cardunculus var. scolymus TaxID=59895 RepID=A0A103XJB8_CYNCS|nr:hypothetical protein Ccrd_006314 [Cynara cardunculus var. scolymus]